MRNRRSTAETGWIGVEAVPRPSILNGKKNWDLGGNAGVVPTRSRIARRFEGEREAKAWAGASPLTRFVFPLSRLENSPERRKQIDQLAREREATYRRTRLHERQEE